MEWALTIFGLLALASIIGFIGFWAICKAGADADDAFHEAMSREREAVLKSETEKEKNEN